MEKTYSFPELRIREYIRLLIESLAATVDESINKKYQKFVDIEKIRYTNTKPYRKQHRQNTSDESISNYSAKLDYWVPVRDSRTNNDPHITYSSYDDNRRVFDLNADIQGFSPSMNKEEYYKNQITELFDVLPSNDILIMLQAYINNKNTWKDISNYNLFCHDHIQDCKAVVNQQLQNFDKYFNLKQMSRNQLQTKSYFLISPEKVEVSFLRKCFYKEDLFEVVDECELEVSIINTCQKSHFIIYTSIYPHQKSILGKRVGDTFSLPNIPNTYKILRIH